MIGRSPIRTSRPFYDKVAHDIGMSGDAKAEEKWRPAGQPYPMPPMKTFRHGEIWVKGFEVARHPHGAGAGRDELDRIQGSAGLHL